MDKTFQDETQAVPVVEVLEELPDDKETVSWINQTFNWKDYLAQYSDKPASERLFKHVNF